MTYPEQLLPQLTFKQITENLTGYFICRKVFDKGLLSKPLPPILSEELLGIETASDCFDYSTNLPGFFELHHNYLELTGEKKKYFRTYWDMASEVDTPVYQQDFLTNENIGWFFIRIDKIQGLTIPFNRKTGEKPNDIATAIVLHTPTNSNFWHFSVRWIDSEGKPITPNSSNWKNSIIAAVRALLSELIELDFPGQTIPKEFYAKN